MDDVRFTCVKCGQTLEAPGEMAGETVECPSCQEALVVPAPAEDPAAAESGSTCPECGAAMDADTVLCVQCGFHKGLGKKIETEFS